MSKSRELVKIFLLSVFSRFQRGKATRAEQKLVEKFFDQMESADQKPAEADLRAIKIQMKQNIDLHLEHKKQSRHISRKIWIPAAAAAILIFVTFSDTTGWLGQDLNTKLASHPLSDGPTLSLGTLHFDNLLDKQPEDARYRAVGNEQVLDLSAVQTQNHTDSLIITNPTKASFMVMLADGTIVRLAPRARIAYLWNDASSRRTVRMQGKVTFEVAQVERAGDRIPFYVETDIQQVAVLGTVFTVDANSAEEHSVHLHEGSIELSHHTSHDKVLLRPGQKAFAALNNPRIYVSDSAADTKKLLAWRKQQFYFDDQRLIDVMTELTAWYGRDITVARAAQNLPITGMIRHYERLEDILDIIKMTNTITYFEQKGVIYVGLK